MTFHVFESRYSTSTPLWSLGGMGSLAALSRTPFTGTRKRRVEQDIDLPSYELYDLHGDGYGLLASAAGKAILEDLQIPGINIVEVEVSFNQTSDPYWFAQILNEHADIVDVEASTIREIDDDGQFEGVRTLRFNEEKLKELPPDSLGMFVIAEASRHLFLSDRIAKALSSSGLTGFKCFPLEAWRKNINLSDPYLSPD